ncbi:hypothetical protein BKA65DRAFT_559914 [Rhexocercosporidium sp. MPI-PUGE-AT-0058]|nr:hypothetical protein BKA65DRAFT_559914 [Rhexocercosporidium sp. MPI-PUGE-AT-0058]
MIQPTIHKYFHAPRPIRAAAKTTFLHLPFTVRREIYLLSGLLANSTIYLNYISPSNEKCNQEYSPLGCEHWPTEPSIAPRSQSLAHFLDRYLSWPQIHLNRHCGCIDEPRANFNPPGFGYRCTCDPLPWQLLYVSNTIAGEVSSIFYSENHFRIFRDGIGGLSCINFLPQTAIRTIRSLEVCLNPIDPEFDFDRRLVGPEEDPDIWYHPGSKQQRLLSGAKPHCETAIDEWKKLCWVLQTHTQPNQLKLFLTSSLADIKIAAEILRPLSQLPPLRECAIRLGTGIPNNSTDYSRHRVLAERHVNRLTQRSFPSPFNFAALPTEIQLQILSHTSLVTPYDLVCSLNYSASSVFKLTFYEARTFLSPCYYAKLVPLDAICCDDCSPSLQMCQCWSRHAAFSSTCTCWRFPLSFFLVNKRMKDLSEAVFYGSNHFRILSSYWRNYKKLEIYNFLTWIPGNGRVYLRNLTWEMTWRSKEYWDGYLLQGDETHDQWLATLDLLVALPQGQLCLTIDANFSQSSIYLTNGGSEYSDSGEIDQPSVYISEAEHSFNVAKMIAKDLARYGVRFKDLFFHFVWPKVGPWKGEGEFGYGWAEPAVEKKRDKGAVLEKLVMGSNYEGEVRGKYKRRKAWNGYREPLLPWVREQ